MPRELRPAYLIHGDDHGAVAERRARLKALGDEADGTVSVELLEAEQATPEGVAAALAAMTLAIGRRVIIADGAERWSKAEVDKQLAPALAQMPPDTTVALFAREDQRAKAPATLHEAVKKAGGQVVAQMTVKPWELPKWVREQGQRLGLELDAAAAKALVARVGTRQQRLLRELEKMALADGPRTIGEEEVDALAAQSAESRVFALADALLEGDAGTAGASYVRLRGQGEQLSGLLYVMAKRLRDAVAAAELLEQGAPVAEVKKSLLPVSGRAADRLIAAVRSSDKQRLREALGALADLEVAARGGSPLPGARNRLNGLQEEDTLAVLALEQITAH